MKSEIIRTFFCKCSAVIKRSISVTIFIAAISMSPFSQAELKKQYFMGVEWHDYAPYFYWKDGEYQGYSRELFDLFEQFANVKIGYRPYRVNELYSVLKQGTVDLKYPDSPSWKEAKKMGENWYYSNSVAPYIDGALVRNSNMSLRLNTLNTLGSIRGFTSLGYDSLAQDHKLKLVPAKGVDSLLEMLLENRVDAVYANISVMNYYMRKNNPASVSAVRFNPSLPYTKHSYFVSTVSHIDIIEKLDEFLIDKSPEIHLLKVKYGLHKVDRVLNR